jgi:SAM-dependent methyltransferase
MSVFGSYSNYYDLFYKDKDYSSETEFIDTLIKKYANGDVKTILDMGCGTGGHAFLLAEKGYEVTGIDRSEGMLSIAKEKAKKTKKMVNFLKADIRDFDLNKKFDVVITMFAVMGYQTSNNEFEATLASVHRHLNSGGLYIFDVWFGPAVLIQTPVDRVKTIELGDKKVTRYAHPILDVVNHTVKVNYTIHEIVGNKLVAETKESHLMRFFFYQELIYFLEKNGFGDLRICPFGKLNNKVDMDCWNISVICRGI